MSIVLKIPSSRLMLVWRLRWIAHADDFFAMVGWRGEMDRVHQHLRGGVGGGGDGDGDR